MAMLWWGIAYFPIHLALYVVALRCLGSLRSERGIFSFHIASAALFTMSTVALVLPDGVIGAFTAGAAAASAHGIYSLSFLELWSLSQASFSFKVLASVRAEPNARIAVIKQNLADVGRDKKANRMATLIKLGLLVVDGEKLRLTRVGWVVAECLRVMQMISNLRRTG